MKMPLKPLDLSKIPKHKAFGVKEAVAGAKAGKRIAGGTSAGPLTRRMNALKKNHTESAFGIDHAVEIEKFSFGGGAALKAIKGVQAGGAKLAASGTTRKFNAIPRMAAGKGGKASYKVGSVQQKVGGAIAGASTGKIAGVSAAAGGAAVGGGAGAAYGMNRKKKL
jgi:hypothetical protein